MQLIMIKTTEESGFRQTLSPLIFNDIGQTFERLDRLVGSGNAIIIVAPFAFYVRVIGINGVQFNWRNIRLVTRFTTFVGIATSYTAESPV